jgi:hypothetical protein
VVTSPRKRDPLIKKTAGFEIAAVMRRDEDKAQDYAKRQWNRKYYTDADVDQRS